MVSTILIVDDMKSNIDMLASILNEEYSIMVAISGENAIKALDRRKPDIVLLDLSMPGIDGFGVLEHMKGREDLKNIPVIFVTGEQDELIEEKGLLLGAVDYIKKPYNAGIVRCKVRNHLALKVDRDSLELMVHQRTLELEKLAAQLKISHEAIIMGMSLMSESHDKVTGDHIKRIKVFTSILAEKTKLLYPDLLTPEMARQIVLYSPLHDVGKVSISDSILKKQGALTDDEFEAFKDHTLGGARLLRDTELLLEKSRNSVDLHVAIEIAKSHHEKYDGSGYPEGLLGDEIPISARIVALADVYDALRSPRPYKKTFSHKEAFEMIFRGESRTKPDHFDPRLLKIFESINHEFEKAYEIQNLDMFYHNSNT